MLGGLHFLPFTDTLFYLFLGVLLVLALLAGIGLLRFTYESIGIGRRHMFSILALSLFGSYLNIPVARLPSETVVTPTVVNMWGITYVVPTTVDWPGTIVALNLGGAIIPIAISFYLLYRNRLWAQAILGVTAVAVVTHWLAFPVRGVGIAVPFFVPPLLAGVVAFVISRERAAPLAYISGSLGTLIGADLLNLGQIRDLNASIASIGGAGTFDGIFLSAVFAVLLAGMLNALRRRVHPSR